jgi:molybdate transport system substrate-binding protein
MVFLRYAFCLCLAGVASLAAEIQVFAAASLTDALQEIAASHHRRSGDRPVFNLGASSTLARQIREGAPADLFISADEEKMDALENAGLIENATRVRLLSNSLVVVIANDSQLQINEPADLAKARRIALAQPKTVPAGIYARKFLERQNLWATLQSSVIPTQNVRAALAAVESGNVDAAIVYKTDAAISRKVKVAWAIPIQDTPAITYPAAVIKNSRNAIAAREFLRYLDSPEAKKIFAKFGFQF